MKFCCHVKKKPKVEQSRGPFIQRRNTISDEIPTLRSETKKEERKEEFEGPSTQRATPSYLKDSFTNSHQSSFISQVFEIVYFMRVFDGGCYDESSASDKIQVGGGVEPSKCSLQEEKEFVSRLIYNKTKTKSHYLEYKWALLYTKYLNNSRVKIPPINNAILLREAFRTMKGPVIINSPEILEPGLEKDSDYVMINEQAWAFIIMVYGGGPEIRIDQPHSKIKGNYLPPKILHDEDIYYDELTQYFIPIVGLCNPKYQCYLNSVLQCLLTSSEFVQYFVETPFPINKKHSKGLQDFFLEIMRSKANYSIATQRTLSVIQKRFTGTQQHDTQELFLYLLSQLKEENQYPDSDHSTTPQASKMQSQLIQSSEGQPIIDKLYQGEITTTIICLWCKSPSNRQEPFFDLSLPIMYEINLHTRIPESNRSQQFTINDCLQNYFQEEMLNDSWICDKCLRMQPTIRKVSRLSKAPKILVIHLKRFRNLPKKTKIRNAAVYKNYLNMAPQFQKFYERFCTSEVKKTIYTLKAVIQHKGGLDQGHYMTSAKRDSQVQYKHYYKWYNFDDEIVTPISPNQILNLDQAYQLFYELF